MIGEPFSIVLAASTAVIGVVCLAASLAGYLLAVLPMWQRFALFGAAILLIKPGIYTDLAGMAIVEVAASLTLMLNDRNASDTAGCAPAPYPPWHGRTDGGCGGKEGGSTGRARMT